jgi:hypothetical protein
MQPLRKRVRQSRKAGHLSLQKRAKFSISTISSPNNFTLNEPLDKKILEEELEPGLKLESLGEEDFLNEKSQLEIGKYFWAAVKRYTRENCNYSFAELEVTVMP